MRTPHADQDSDPLEGGNVRHSRSFPLPGPFIQMMVADIEHDRPTLFGPALPRLDAGTLEGTHRLWVWECALRLGGTEERRVVALLVWAHRQKLVAVLDDPQEVPPGILGLICRASRYDPVLWGRSAGLLRRAVVDPAIRWAWAEFGDLWRGLGYDSREELAQVVLWGDADRLGGVVEDAIQVDRPPWELAPYLRKVVRHRIADLLGAALRDADMRAMDEVASDLGMDDAATEGVAEVAEAEVMIEDARVRLTGRQREVLDLRHDGYPDAEIAKCLGVSRQWISEIAQEIAKRLGPWWRASSS